MNTFVYTKILAHLNTIDDITLLTRPERSLQRLALLSQDVRRFNTLPPEYVLREILLTAAEGEIDGALTAHIRGFDLDSALGEFLCALNLTWAHTVGKMHQNKRS